MNDTTQRIEQTDWKVPEKYQDRVIDDRAATQAEAIQAMDIDVRRSADKPIAVWLSAQELGAHVARYGTPFEFNQMLLAKLKAAGAPVEGQLALRLAHGAVAKVKPDAAKKEFGWKYIRLPEEYVAAIAAGGR